MKVILFGSNGMLGRYVKYILEQSYQVLSLTRHDFDIEQNTWDYLEVLLSYHLKPNDIIVNCAGIIPQRTPETDIKPYIRVNTLFPHMLQHIATKYQAILIHITTDCVFAGTCPPENHPYTERSPHTATHLYGITKSQGEPLEACIIRTSIIGEDPFHKTGLLEWVRQHQHTSLPGYTNHLWNGVTCLQLAEVIHSMIATKTFWKGPRHIFSPSLMTKYFLCQLISDTYQLNNTVLPTEAPTLKNMELQSIYPPLYNIDPIPLQIKKQRELHLIDLSQFTAYHHPFPYFVTKNALNSDYATHLQQDIRAMDITTFDRLENPFEQKYVLRDKSSMPQSAKQLFQYLTSSFFLDQLSSFLHIQLYNDPDKNFWGIHKFKHNDRLDIHLDAGIYKDRKKYLTLGLYLSYNWTMNNGGNLQLWEGDPVTTPHYKLHHLAAEIPPYFNTMVLFINNDKAWHGAPDPVTCNNSQSERIFLTCSYLVDASIASQHPLFQNAHQKALFIPRPTDPYDEEKLKAIQLRANPATCQLMYRVPKS